MRRPILCLLPIAMCLSLLLGACAQSTATPTTQPAPSEVPTRTRPPETELAGPPCLIETTTDATGAAPVRLSGNDAVVFAADASAPTAGLTDISIAVYRQDELVAVLASDTHGRFQPRLLILPEDVISAERTVLLSSQTEITLSPPVSVIPGIGATVATVPPDELGSFQEENSLETTSIAVFIDLEIESGTDVVVELSESPFEEVMYGVVRQTSSFSHRSVVGNASPLRLPMAFGVFHGSLGWQLVGDMVGHLVHIDVPFVEPLPEWGPFLCYWYESGDEDRKDVNYMGLHDYCLLPHYVDGSPIKSVESVWFNSSPESVHVRADTPVPPTLEVPDVDNGDLTVAQATDIIEAAGLVAEVGEAAHSDVPEGFVFAQDPRAGTEVLRGASVSIRPSLGPEPSVPPTSGTGTVLGFNARWDSRVSLYSVPKGLPAAHQVCGISGSAASGYLHAEYHAELVDTIEEVGANQAFRFDNVPTGIPLYLFAGWRQSPRCPGTQGDDLGLYCFYGSRIFTLQPGQTIDVGDVHTCIISCPCD